MTHTIAHWLLIFFAYCILGWMWETAFVSVRSRRWVNRGFLYGPWLPIYGFGALIILLMTQSVAGSAALIFLLGMLGATALEYVTGAVMERLFHMRYWDYSKQPLNVKGYICLPVSLGWGVFALLLVSVVHPPVEALLQRIPECWSVAASAVLVGLFAADVVKSVQAALGTKALLSKLAGAETALRGLESRMEAAMEQLSAGSAMFRQRIQQIEAALKREPVRRESGATRRADLIKGWVTERREHKSSLLAVLKEKSEAVLGEATARLAQEMPEVERERLEKLRGSMRELQEALGRMEADLTSRREREFRRAASILERNPSAVSPRYQEILSELKGLKWENLKKNMKKRKGE